MGRKEKGRRVGECERRRYRKVGRLWEKEKGRRVGECERRRYRKVGRLW